MQATQRPSIRSRRITANWNSPNNWQLNILPSMDQIWQLTPTFRCQMCQPKSSQRSEAQAKPWLTLHLWQQWCRAMIKRSNWIPFQRKSTPRGFQAKACPHSLSRLNKSKPRIILNLKQSNSLRGNFNSVVRVRQCNPRFKTQVKSTLIRLKFL